MPRRTDFAKERRAQGRALSTSVRQFIEQMQTTAEQQGVDLQSLFEQAEAQTAEKRSQLIERL